MTEPSRSQTIPAEIDVDTRSADSVPGGRGSRETPLSAWLKAVLWGALIIPLAVFVIGCWWSFEQARTDAENGLSHAAQLAFRQAERAFQVAEEIAVRADRAANIPDAELRARESDIHQRLSDMAAGLTSVVNASIWDASGSIAARSDVYPVDPAFNISDRAYFRQHMTGSASLAVSEVRIGRQSGKELMNVTRRRSSPDGAFRGVIAVSLAPTFFTDYYRSLAGDQAALSSFVLLRTDGEVLARWPDDGRVLLVPSTDSLMKLVSAGVEYGRLVVNSQAGSDTQIVKLKRLENVPAVVVTSYSRKAMLSDWARFVALLAAILGPVTAGLVYVTWVALRKTRQEQAVSAELQREVHARGLAEKKMLESQKFETLAFVTGSVAHDFNNLLAIISSSVHVFRRRNPAVTEDKYLAAVNKAVQAGIRLTRQLLSFSQKQVLRPEPVSLQSWIPSVEALLRSTLGSNVRWTANIEPDTRPVMIDVGELELALINLALNAKHAMPNGGSFTVHIANDEESLAGPGMVEVCVSDTGLGIAPDILHRVFEPFFTTRQKGVGSGLGLSQVHSFCLASGGRATIRSVVGSGTAVCLHLPATDQAPAAAPSSIPIENVEIDARLLLVEDNETVAMTTEQLLRSAGWKVVRVESADAAIDHLAMASPMPDIVLSDIMMPGAINGIGLALEMRRLHPDIPVLLTTGYAEQIRHAAAEGLRVYQKPVPPEELLAALRALVKNVRQQAGV